MGRVHTINEALVTNLALLAAGSCCVATGVGLTAFGIFAAPALGIGGWSLAKWFSRLKDKDPKNEKAIRRIQDRINETLTGNIRFAEIDPDILAQADIELTKAVARYWPAPKVVAELAKDIDGFPNAIANHILDEINGSPLTSGLFEDENACIYAKAVISAALDAGLDDKVYFESLQPHVMMETLGLTGQIQRDVERFIEKLDNLKLCLGEMLVLLNDIRATQLEDSQKLDAILHKIELSKDTQLDRDIELQLRKTIAEMLSSERQSSMDAVKELMAEPARPQAATNRLRQAIAEQDDVEQEAKQNKSVLWKEVAAINYFTNGEEAVHAHQELVKIDPCNTDSWRQLGHLNKRLGNLDRAVEAYKKLESIGKSLKNKELQIIANNCLGIIAKTCGNFAQAVSYYENALKLNEELGQLDWSATIYNNLGDLSRIQEDFNSAESYFEKSLKINEELDNKQGIATNYYNLGMLAQIRMDLDEAESFQNKSLSLNKELECKQGMAQSYSNLGIIECIRNNFEASVTYHEKSLEIETALHHKKGIASDYSNLGLTWLESGDLARAAHYFEKSLALSEQLGRKHSIATAHGNLGIVAKRRGDLDVAVLHYEKSLVLNEELDQKEGIASNYNNLGLVAQMQGDIEAAIKYWKDALLLFSDIGNFSKASNTQRLIDGVAQKL